MFLAFVSLSQVPSTDVKILATALAPALVAALGPANWWLPRWARRDAGPA